MQEDGWMDKVILFHDELTKDEWKTTPTNAKSQNKQKKFTYAVPQATTRGNVQILFTLYLNELEKGWGFILIVFHTL